MIKDKRMRNILLYLVVVMASVFFVGFFTAKNAYASDFQNNNESAFDVMLRLGFEDALNRDEYQYHLLAVKQTSGSKRFIHYYSNEPIQISYDYSSSTGRHELWITNCYFDQYYLDGRLDYRFVDINDSDRLFTEFTNFSSKEDLLTYDFSPSEELDAKVCSIYYVSGSPGVVVKDDSLADLGYPSGSVFFWSAPPKILTPIMAEMKTQNQLQPLSQMVSLIPISLGLVVSFLALRKTWRMLKTLLYQA